MAFSQQSSGNYSERELNCFEKFLKLHNMFNKLDDF